jgi:hypothetical protein
MKSKHFCRIKNFVLGLVLTSLSFAPAVSARPLQIIHTNDLHSFLERGDTSETGGYAAVKAVIDQTGSFVEVQKLAASKGIKETEYDPGASDSTAPAADATTNGNGNDVLSGRAAQVVAKVKTVGEKAAAAKEILGKETMEETEKSAAIGHLKEGRAALKQAQVEQRQLLEDIGKAANLDAAKAKAQ